jgi:hypothetical protein
MERTDYGDPNKGREGYHWNSVLEVIGATAAEGCLFLAVVIFQRL